MATADTAHRVTPSPLTKLPRRRGTWPSAHIAWYVLVAKAAAYSGTSSAQVLLLGLNVARAFHTNGMLGSLPAPELFSEVWLPRDGDSGCSSSMTACECEASSHFGDSGGDSCAEAEAEAEAEAGATVGPGGTDAGAGAGAGVPAVIGGGGGGDGGESEFSICTGEWGTEVDQRDRRQCLVVVFPHPSGASHFWNDAGQVQRAARALRRAMRRVGLLPGRLRAAIDHHSPLPPSPGRLRVKAELDNEGLEPPLPPGRLRAAVDRAALAPAPRQYKT
jgi:hypothetical protein